MASIGNQKEALLKQIEGIRNRVTLNQIISLLGRYEDLSVEDFRDRIPEALFEQLRNPQEAKAWNDIVSTKPDDEGSLRTLIGDITNFIKKYPESEKLNEAEMFKKKYEKDLVSMKLYAELEKSNPSSQKEIGYEIQRLSDFIDKYPGFSKIDQARKLLEDLENRIDNSLWQRDWAQITASNPSNRVEYESLLKNVNDFIDEYPISPKLDDAISLKNDLEAKIADLDSEDKAIDMEWKGLAQTKPVTVQDYQQLISKISDFINAHPQWNNIAEAQVLLRNLKSLLDDMIKKQQDDLKRQREEEINRQEAEKKRQEEERKRQEELQKKQQEEALKKENLNKNDDKKDDNGKKYLLIILLALAAILGLLYFLGVFSDNEKEDTSGTEVVKENPEEAVVAENPNGPADKPDTLAMGNDKPEKKEKDESKANGTPKPAEPTTITPPTPKVPGWVTDFEKINRNVNGGEIVKIEFEPDKYDPKKVILTVHYPNFSVDAMSAADRETIKNLNINIIKMYKGKTPVDIKIISLDVNNKNIN